MHGACAFDVCANFTGILLHSQRIRERTALLTEYCLSSLEMWKAGDMDEAHGRMIRLTPHNAKLYIGSYVFFESAKQKVRCKIKSVSNSGESINVDFPKLQNCLGIKRRLYVEA